MKILIISPYFYPEDFRINDFAFKMDNQGHEVTVLTGLPNYPKGKFFGKFNVFFPENINNVKVYRVPILPRFNGGNISLLFNYFSFLFSGLILGPILLLNKKFDIIFAVNYSPPTSSLIGSLIKFFKGSPLFIWVQDLWPESLEATNVLKKGLITKSIRSLMAKIFAYSDKILIQSRSFSRHIPLADKSKVHYLPNWAEEIYKTHSASAKKYEYLLPKNKFIIMFAGNLGKAQSIGTIIDAAIKLKNSKIHWVFLGDGREKKQLEITIKQKNLKDNISVLGRYPQNDMPHFFNLADAMLVTLVKNDALSMTIPGKIQSYMKSGKPLLSALDGEGGKIIEESGAGLNGPSEDSETLAKNARILSLMSSEDLKNLGLRSKKYYLDNFDEKKNLRQLVSLFEKEISKKNT